MSSAKMKTMLGFSEAALAKTGSPKNEVRRNMSAVFMIMTDYRKSKLELSLSRISIREIGPQEIE